MRTYNDVGFQAFENLTHNAYAARLRQMYAQPLVVHLERPYREYKLSEAPAKDLVRMWLRRPTPSWPELAVVWLKQRMPLDAEIAKCLEQIMNRANWRQRLRHRAQALRRAWLCTTRWSLRRQIAVK